MLTLVSINLIINLKHRTKMKNTNIIKNLPNSIRRIESEEAKGTRNQGFLWIFSKDLVATFGTPSKNLNEKVKNHWGFQTCKGVASIYDYCSKRSFAKNTCWRVGGESEGAAALLIEELELSGVEFIYKTQEQYFSEI